MNAVASGGNDSAEQRRKALLQGERREDTLVSPRATRPPQSAQVGDGTILHRSVDDATGEICTGGDSGRFRQAGGGVAERS